MKTYILIILASIILTGCTSVDAYHVGKVHTPNGDYVDTVHTQNSPPSLMQLIFGNMFNFAFAPQGYYFYGNYYPPTTYDPYYGPVGIYPSFYR